MKSFTQTAVSQNNSIYTLSKPTMEVIKYTLKLLPLDTNSCPESSDNVAGMPCGIRLMTPHT